MHDLESQVSSATQADREVPRLGSMENQVFYALVVTVAVFISALLGIFTRPIGLLAAFWPANAVLLGLMISSPKRPLPLAWVGAFVAYILADLVTGGELLITFWMTLANMSGVVTGYVLYRRLPDRDRVLGRPMSVLLMFCVCGVAAVVAAIIGGGSARVLFNQDFLGGLEFWFSGELVNYLAILPVILAFSGRNTESANTVRRRDAQQDVVWHSAPLAALIFSLMISAVFGGPGAISFPVPALLWCALTYSLFSTSLCTLGFCAWMLIASASGVVDLPISGDILRSTSSARLGVALICIAPLAAAAVNASRLTVMAKFERAAHFDFLTGVLSRGEFLDRGRGLLRRGARDSKLIAVLMLDIDWFKRINDTHGHAVGDEVLIVFSEIIKSAVRSDDILGRIGGEEFAFVLPGQSSERALATAERIRVALANQFSAKVPRVGTLTVSVGVASTDRHPGNDVESLLSIADQALYKAKNEGRDRVMLG